MQRERLVVRESMKVGTAVDAFDYILLSRLL